MFRDRRFYRAVVVLTLWVAAVLASCSLASAQPQTTRFTGQFSPTALPEGTSFALSGDQVTRFSAMVDPTACAAPSDWQNSDDYFKLKMTSGTKVTLSGGKFSFSGTAVSEYGAGSPTKPYGGQFTITGTVNPDHTLVTAKVALSEANDPYLTGCSGRYKFVAIPATEARSRNVRGSYQSQFVKFDYAAGVVRNLYVQANFFCGQGEDAAYVYAPTYGYPTLQTTANGTFHLKLYAIDEYKDIVVVHINGRVVGKKASGKVVVSEPPGGFIGPGKERCSGTTHWTAAKPAPPTPPGPSAFFQWAAIRVPTGASYHYYFAADQLQCSNGANEVLVTVAHRTTTINCSQSVAWASGPLAPSQTYTVTSQAVEAKGGHIIKRGTKVTVPLAMPGPGDNWQHRVSGLPSNPPR